MRWVTQLNRRMRKLKLFISSNKGIFYCIIVLILLYFFSFFSKSNTRIVLLTGGLGFIGSNLAEELLSEGYKVIVFDDKSTGRTETPGTLTIIGDITNTSHFDRIKGKVDFVIHLAAAISVAESISNPKKYDKINVDGSRNVFQWALFHGVKRVVSASSAAVYGTPQSLPLDELSPKSPLSPYADTKLKMEQIQEDFFWLHNLKSTALRFFNVYGPRQNPKSPYSGVISKFIEQAVNGKNITIFGDGSNSRDFVFVKDVARACIAALKDEKDFQIYNVGTETRITMKQLANLVIELVGSESSVVYLPERAGDIKHSLSNSQKLKKDLKWKPHISLNNGLEKTIAWYKSQF